MSAAALAVGLALVPARAGAADAVSLSATRTLTVLPPSAFGGDGPGDGSVLDGHHHDDGVWLGVVRAQVTKFVADAAVCAPTGYLSLQVVSPSRSSYSLGLLYTSKNDNAPLALDGTGSADLKGARADANGPLPEFLIVLGGSGDAPTKVDVKLSWTSVADPQCTGVAAPAPMLQVITHVSGGSATAGQWSAHVQNGSGAEVAGSPQPGSETGTTYTLSPGTFSVSETGGASGYTATVSGDCDASGHVSLAAGDQKTCTLTETAAAPPPPAPATLTVIKHVVGGSAAAGRWSLHVRDTSGAEVAGSPQPGSEAGTTYTLPAGTLTLSETGDLSGYTGAFSGDCDAHGTVTLLAGDRKTCTLTNTYADTTPPVLHGPGDLTATATSSNGAVVSYDVTATDPDDEPITAHCSSSPSGLGSGSTFPIGTTGIHCTASDPAGNVAVPLDFTVTVLDAAPFVTVPANIEDSTGDPSGKAESFAVSATDYLDGALLASCDHAPGSTFPVGATTVLCSATNSSHLTTTASFTVTIRYVDVTPPVLHGPGALSATATSPAGAVVSFVVTATDPDDGAVTVACDHDSGATFPIAVTIVTCHAHDSAGNEALPVNFTVTVADAAPLLRVPGDVSDTTNDRGGKVETFAASATDFEDGSVPVTCDHASGEIFPVGATTVHCRATNSSGQTTSGSFVVTIAYLDVTPPVLHGPGDLTATATSSAGAVVSFAVTASDPDDALGALTVVCDHSGGTFPIGVTTVTCHAHDPAGNEAQPVGFTVTVTDAAPSLSLPADISDTTSAQGGKAETFAVTASDFADGTVPVVCDHASGASFPVGTTTVHCSATNSSGERTDASFTVTVAYVDVTAPTIHGPGDSTTTATSSNGAVVSFAVSATDPDDDHPTVACDRASGATFPIGVTTVTCHAHDPAGNEAQPIGFTVTVTDAAPRLSLPDSIHDVSHDPKGLRETFAVSASDFADGTVPVVCDHTSGESFPVGTTTVHCSATNRSGERTDASFTVTVTYVDTSAPVIHTSGDQHLTGTSAAGATVFYTATADDPDDNTAVLTLACGPLQSGATFPVGATLVTCTASDPAGGQAAPATFTVTVDPPSPPPPPTVSVVVSSPTLARVGEDVSFSVVVKSASETASTGISVHARVPEGASLVSTSGAATCTGQTDVVCQFGTLQAGSSATQTIVLRPAQAGSLSLFATVSGEGAAGSSSASTAVLDPGAPPPPPPPPTQPQTFNAISTGTVLVNGVPQPSDTLFLVVSGDHIELNGQLAITTFAGNSGVFSNVPFTSRRRTSAVGAIGGRPESFTVNTTGGGTTMTLSGGDFNVCKTSRRTAAHKPKAVVRQLWGRAHGQFTTKAQYSSATIRGTTWGVQDRCDGSFTTAVDDFVTVVDFTTKRTLTLAPGETYLATPPRTPAGVFKPPTEASLQTAASVGSRGLLWAGRRFRTKAQFSAWLVSKGSSWRAFAAKNPALAKALASR